MSTQDWRPGDPRFWGQPEHMPTRPSAAPTVPAVPVTTPSSELTIQEWRRMRFLRWLVEHGRIGKPDAE